jgi:hypothetical protein
MLLVIRFGAKWPVLLTWFRGWESLGTILMRFLHRWTNTGGRDTRHFIAKNADDFLCAPITDIDMVSSCAFLMADVMRRSCGSFTSCPPGGWWTNRVGGGRCYKVAVQKNAALGSQHVSSNLVLRGFYITAGDDLDQMVV